MRGGGELGRKGREGQEGEHRTRISPSASSGMSVSFAPWCLGMTSYAQNRVLMSVVLLSDIKQGGDKSRSAGTDSGPDRSCETSRLLPEETHWGSGAGAGMELTAWPLLSG